MIFNLSFANAFPQTLVQEITSIPVMEGGSSLTYPFLGGVYKPEIQFRDIDDDGDPDLFITRDDGRLMMMRNQGSAAVPNFVFETNFFEDLMVEDWCKFVDIDADGDLDLYAHTGQRELKFYRNTGTAANPSFALILDPVLDLDNNPMVSDFLIIPFFADVDCDGDFDFFAGKESGTVTFYENQGTPQSPAFRFITDTFDNIVIIGGGLKAEGTELHGASAITAADIDNDSDPDIIWGDFFSPGLYYVKNLGNCPNYSYSVVSDTFPDASLNTGFFGFNMPEFVDIDGDNDLDLFVGTLFQNILKDNFWYYRNEGSGSSPNFQFVTKNYLSTLDVGKRASADLVDIDDDGDLDLFVGQEGTDPVWLAYYRNVGSVSSPSFQRISAQFIVEPGKYNFVPAFVDIDNDGDYDLFCGDFNGKLIFYRNNGTPAAPVFNKEVFQTDGIDIGNFAAPVFGDLDDDGDLDLMIGEEGQLIMGNRVGNINYYRNDGTVSTANFVLVNGLMTDGDLTSGTMIDVGEYSVPELHDLEADGDLDLVIGNQEGYLVHYRNDGSASVPNFILIDPQAQGVKAALRSVPRFADINNDQKPDLFLGNDRGGLEYYRATGPLSVKGDLVVPAAVVLDQNYPNPFNPSTQISFRLSVHSDVELSVFNLLGQKMVVLAQGERAAGVHLVTWDGANDDGQPVASGVYFYRLEAAGWSYTRKMMLLR